MKSSNQKDKLSCNNCKNCDLKNTVSNILLMCKKIRSVYNGKHPILYTTNMIYEILEESNNLESNINNNCNILKSSN